MPALRYGGIVGAYLQTKKKGKQLHPAVILTPDAEIIQPENFDPRSGNDNIVVAIGVTTKYRLYNEPFVALPYAANGHVVTGLTEDCAAIIGWYSKLYVPDDICFHARHVPPELMASINAMVRDDLRKKFGQSVVSIGEALMELLGDH